ncbi:MAG: cytochrome c peroxidase [Acidobacteriota bacterium]
MIAQSFARRRHRIRPTAEALAFPLFSFPVFSFPLFSFPLFILILSALIPMALLAPLAASAQLPPPPVPPGNPITADKVNLGKTLFWDEQLSSTRTVSCGTCHIPSAGGSDPRSATSPLAIHPGPDGVFGTVDDRFGSPGVPNHRADGSYMLDPSFGLTEQATPRRTMSMINAAYSPELFWDGRAREEFVDPVTQAVILPEGGALENQALGPVVSTVEMAHSTRDLADVVARVGAIDPLALASHVPSALDTWLAGRSYDQLFEAAFGSPGITEVRLALALATYQRVLVSDQTPFDEFLAQGTGLTAREERGRDVFVASSCDRCHQREILTDHSFRNTGLRPNDEDLGRFDVTGDPEDRGKMRTPSLRNVELRAPYMSNGRLATLEEVIDFYDRGGDFDEPNKDPFVRRLDLTAQEKADLLAFITRPLTDPRVTAEEPPFDRPRLYTEADAVAVVDGAGVASGGGVTPRIVALEPPLLGSPSFTVAVFDADGDQARLVIDDQPLGTVPPASAPPGSLAFVTIALEDDGAGLGYGSTSIALPSDPSLDGRPFFGRWYVLNSGGSVAAVSPPFRFKTFRARGLERLFADGFEDGGTAFWSATVP